MSQASSSCRDLPFGACCSDAISWSMRICTRASAPMTPFRSFRSVAASRVTTLSVRRSSKSCERLLVGGLPTHTVVGSAVAREIDVSSASGTKFVSFLCVASSKPLAT